MVPVVPKWCPTLQNNFAKRYNTLKHEYEKMLVLSPFKGERYKNEWAFISKNSPNTFLEIE